MFDEADLLPVSGLQHLAFCRRQWAMIHLEQFWSENRLTTEGRHLHERADGDSIEMRGNVRIVRGLRIRSLALGLIGRADVVEFHRAVSGGGRACRPDAHPAHTDDGESDGKASNEGVPLPGVEGIWRPFPIEYKRGRPKPWNCDRV